MLSGATLSACATAGTAVLRMVVSIDSMKNPTATSQGSSRLAVSLGGLSLAAGKGGIDDDLCLGDQSAQVRGVAKTLGVNFINVFGPGWPSREPTAARDHFHAADGRIVAGCVSQNRIDRVAGKLLAANLLPIEFCELLFLLRGRGSIDPCGEELAQFLPHDGVLLAGIAPGAGRNFRRQQGRYQAILVGGPDAAVDPAEGGAGAFLSAET